MGDDDNEACVPSSLRASPPVRWRLSEAYRIRVAVQTAEMLNACCMFALYSQRDRHLSTTRVVVASYMRHRTVSLPGDREETFLGYVSGPPMEPTICVDQSSPASHQRGRAKDCKMRSCYSL
eukprot:scaffold88728_cov20-Prasinocladus_malaysianus.AAC.2